MLNQLFEATTVVVLGCTRVNRIELNPDLQVNTEALTPPLLLPRKVSYQLTIHYTQDLGRRIEAVLFLCDNETGNISVLQGIL